MPILPFLSGKSFDPETLDVLNSAFLAACADLGVTDKTPYSRENVAKRVLELSHGRRDPEAIRAAVVAALKERR